VKGVPPRQPEPVEQLPAVEGIIADAAELRPGDRVIYPNQGVCQIVGTEQKDIAGQKLELVRMSRIEDGATVMVPRGKVPTVGLRKVATAQQMENVFNYLAAATDDPELDWKVRHRDHADRMIGGGVIGVAEVLKALHSLSRIRPLPAKERELYDNARHLLVHEVAVALQVTPALAEDFIDYALMPPQGVKFDVKAPPRQVIASTLRPRRRHGPTTAAATTEVEEDLDLSLDAEAGIEGELPEGGGEEGGEAEAQGREVETEEMSLTPLKPEPAKRAAAKPAPMKAAAAAKKAPPKKTAKAAKPDKKSSKGREKK
jgi:RNA polymerase-interacting CarD/CdnL/TRCF family regulator